MDGENEVQVLGSHTIENKKIISRSLWPQILLLMASIFVSLSTSMSASYSAILLPQLNADNHTISVNDETASWIVSSYAIMGPLGCIFGGIAADLWGRKKMNISGCLGIILGSSYTSFSLGILIISILGSTLHWRTASAICVGLPLILLIICFLIPETPTWLVRRNRLEKAQGVLSWFWGTDGKIQKDLIKEIKKIISNLKRLLKPHVLKPFLIMHIFNSIQLICGNFHFVFYSVDILSKVKSNSTQEYLDVYFCNILLSTVRFIFTTASSMCLLWIGRRTIGLISGIVASLSNLIVAILIYTRASEKYSQTIDRIIFALIILYIGFYAFGCILPTMMLGETQSSEIRGFICGYIFTINDIILGIVIQRYFSMVQAIGIEGMFVLFGSSCLFCTIFIYFFIPETQGKTLLEIESYFHQGNLLWNTKKKYLLPTQISKINTSGNTSLLIQCNTMQDITNSKQHNNIVRKERFSLFQTSCLQNMVSVIC
ncbi:hypothetical protein C0J52_22003 [Blattella germanica]|nr:hypothetical protein C0J52_22003 [Blattella germanica]